MLRLAFLTVLTLAGITFMIMSSSLGDGKFGTFAINGKIKTEDKNKLDKNLRYLFNMKMHSKRSLCPRGRTSTLSTTLVTQTTLDRLELIFQTCERWKSQIITVVYLTVDEQENSWSSISKEYNSTCPHLKLIPYVSVLEDERSHAYPINKLRNIALDNVATSHVLLIDADFIPSVGLDVAVQKAINLAANKVKPSSTAGPNQYALVVPAYERQLKTSPCESFEGCLKIAKEDPEFMPKSMSSLKKCTKDEKCIVFHSDYFPQGHGNTNSEKWLRKMDKSKITAIPCIADEYEPYVVIPWCPSKSHKFARTGGGTWKPISPYYDERFYGYGMNKIQQIKHLQAKGYRFAVIPALGFLVHHPHPESSTKKIWRGKKGEKLQTDGMKNKMFMLFDQYTKDLIIEYSGTKMRTKRCINKSWSSKPWWYALIVLSVLLLVTCRRNIDNIAQFYQQRYTKDDRQMR